MSAKYQVFVSSTYIDLKEERNMIIKAVLEMGHIPVGMEMFSAADEEQWNIIKKQVDQSDYYVVVVAHRYGSCDRAGVGYTEKEFDYAVSTGGPILGFVVDDGVSWPREKSETDGLAISKLSSFKDKVKSRPVSFWRNSDDLYGRCSIALMKAFNAYPRDGWVRASEVQDAAASKEVIRLSAENAKLREAVAEFQSKVDQDILIAQRLDILRGNTVRLSAWRKGASGWSDRTELTLYQIFEIFAPELQVENDLAYLSRFAATNLLNIPFVDIRPTWATPRNVIRSILADFSALDCIVPSTRKKPVSDKGEYWALSGFGAKMLAHMRLRRLENIESLAKVTGGEGDASADTDADADV